MKSLKTIFCITIVIATLLSTGLLGSAVAESVAITNVRVFDGNALSELRTIVIENGLISAKTSADTVIDGNGGALLPGLIDSHVHLEGVESLQNAAQWGITTMLDMGTALSSVNDLHNLSGLPTVSGSGISAAPAGGAHAAMGCVAVTSEQEAQTYVVDRVAENVDYIKVIVDSPKDGGFVVMEEPVLTELVASAHKHNLKVVAHVTLDDSIEMCSRASVDVITHLPIGKPVNAELAKKAAQKQMAAIPTLVMMKCIFDGIPADKRPQGMDYENAAVSMLALKNAGVNLMAGTDANTSVCRVIHGKSLHNELQLMVDAGMSPVEALRCATLAPAAYWGFNDRGVIEPGRRADLVLVKGDPTQDISAAMNIMGVWIKGERVR